MKRIVRVAIVTITLALFFASSFNAWLGHRDIAVMLALGTPLGISAWGFARAGYPEPAMLLVSGVLIVAVTMILMLNPLGVHDVAVSGYGAVVLLAALLLSRRSFVIVTALTVAAAASAFALDLHGHTQSVVAFHSGWPQLVELLVMIAVFAVIGRYAAETLFGSLGAARVAAIGDPVTGLANRAAFISHAGARLAAASREGTGVLVLADLDGFRRVNLVVGHPAADRVLVETAQRLLAVAPAHLAARIDGDEFALLALGLDGEGAGEALARAVHEALNFEFSGVSVRNATGYARFPRDGDGIEGLLLAAEASLTAAKAVEEGARLAGPADRI